ncbi:MAG: insulinase family protein, partial [Neisseria animaloris]|nr:insulinase family protein [Neisseria animaloris]
LLESIRSEIKNIADNGISQSELERVRRLSAASEIYAKDSMTSQASLLGQLETRGFKYSDEAEIRRRLQKVSAADVQAAAKLLTPQRSSVVVVRPEAAYVKKP